MKKIICLVLALVLLLCGCAGDKSPETMASEPTTVPTVPETAPATEPPTEPPTEPAPVYRNPLNGTILEQPFDGRVYAVTISNIPDALPHVGVTHADVLMEMYVNGSIIRCLALYTQPENAATIGSVRSTRLMFNDIVQHYNAVLFHAGGSSQVLANARERGIANFNVDAWEMQSTGISTRDDSRKRFIGWEHCLVVNGTQVKAFAESQGIPVTVDEEADYGLLFTEDGTPAAGEAADVINVKIVYGRSNKMTILEYNPDLGKYHYGGIYYEKKIMHTDEVTEEPEAFENVVIMHANITTNGIYHVADFVAGGTGYYACGGKIIPITWTCDGEDQPFRFFTAEGESLAFGEGSTYIAIAHPDSPVTWEALEAEAGAES